MNQQDLKGVDQQDAEQQVGKESKLRVGKKSKLRDAEKQERKAYVRMCVEALKVKSLVDLVLKNKLFDTKLLSKCDGTALLRVASLKECPVFAKLVLDFFGVVGVPFKLRLDGEASNFTLFKHQQRTINLLYRASKANHDPKFLAKVHNTRGALVVMKMGLGKTVTALTHALSTPRRAEDVEMGEAGFPVLVVAPKSVLPMWRDDGVEKFFEPNALKVLYMHEDFMSKSKLDELERRDIIGYDLVVTTYEVVRSGGEGLDAEQVGLDQPTWRGKKLIFGTKWRMVVLDESQRIANLNKTARALRLVRGNDHLCLSGTPMRNSPQDLCAQFMWMGYTGVSHTKQFTHSHMTEHFLNERMFVVSHADTDLVLPPRTHTTELLDATPRERQVYDLIRDHARRELCGPVVDYVCWLAVLTGLRQVCTAPFLVSRKVQPSKVDAHLVGGVPGLAARRKRTQEFAAGIKGVLKKDEALWQALQDPLGEFGVQSTKVVAIVNTIKKAVANNDKVVVFSIWVTTLDIVALALDQHCFKRTKLGSSTSSSTSSSSSSSSSSSTKPLLTGRTKRRRDSDASYTLLHGGTRDRAGVLREFKFGSCNVLLVTHGVGGEGIDLTAASCVICADQWWTPVVHDQAFARVWRPGQKRPVCLYNFVFKNTIEEYMHKMCSEKTEESKLFIYTKKGQPVLRFNATDLASMLG